MISSVLLFLGVFIALPAAYWLWSPWLGALAFVCNLGAFLFSHFAIPAVAKAGLEESPIDTIPVSRSLGSLWPISWMLLPLPMNLDQELTNWLQIRSSRLSSYLLDYLDIPHLQMGNVLEIASGRLFVEEACSGVQSLFTLIFAAILLVSALRRSPWTLPFYVLFAMVCAGIMNVVRILSVAVALHHYGVDLSTGWQHDLLGYVCLGLAATLLLSADRLFRVFFYPARDQETVRQLPNPLVAIWNNIFRLPDSPFAAPTESPRPTESRSPIKSAAFITCTCIAIAGLALQGFRLLQNQPTTSTSTAVAAEPFHNFPEQLPADVISRFTQIKHEQVRGNINMPMGEIGDIWSGVIEGVPVAVAVNQPYADWHDLNACYRGTGWTLNERRTVETKVDGQDWYCVESNWILPNQSYAHVWFSAFTEDGQPVNPLISV